MASPAAGEADMPVENEGAATEEELSVGEAAGAPDTAVEATAAEASEPVAPAADAETSAAPAADEQKQPSKKYPQGRWSAGSDSADKPEDGDPRILDSVQSVSKALKMLNDGFEWAHQECFVYSQREGKWYMHLTLTRILLFAARGRVSDSTLRG